MKIVLMVLKKERWKQDLSQNSLEISHLYQKGFDSSVRVGMQLFGTELSSLGKKT